MKTFACAALLASLAAPALSEATPKAMRVDARSATAVYQKGQVYKINTRLKRVTLITLAAGERFLDFKAGDTESFVFADTDSGNAILVKPVIAGAVTNGVIVTNRRFYLVELHESANRRPHYAVNFSAPSGGGGSASKTRVPAGLPKTYAITAKSKGAEIAPIRVWDDGQRTYFQFGTDAPTPSIYRADAQGREYIVNGRTDGTRSTVGRRSDRWVIRYGDQYICIQSGDV
ncbi:TrbG/VirB9 family P-type conjugative transfer protein [Sedimentitalea sp.]|uniref:TrbG/VirB9 family P-type conjugative transfer protein n=1 Tax=Sedimentitalea sp. TaxID=2048915 RepID=UPI003296BE27